MRFLRRSRTQQKVQRVSSPVGRQRPNALAILAFLAILTGGAPSPHAADCPAGSNDYRTTKGSLAFESFGA